MLRYCSLFSGSSGNCTYVGNETAGVLVDVGVSAKRIETALRDRQIDPGSIRAVFISHEHTDHIAGLQVLYKRYGWPMLASAGTLDALAEAQKVVAGQALYALPAGQALHFHGMTVLPFATSHDSRQCYGYRIESGGVGLAIATDSGFVTDDMMAGMTGCRLVHIESNHDPFMLRNGPYPFCLQQRIRGDGGHLANADCAAVLPQLAAAGAKRFVLAHLSQHNNTPALAEQTAEAALSAAGYVRERDYRLSIAAPVGTQNVETIA